MGDKPLAWASKLPISAASFVGSLFSFLNKKVLGFCGSILFTLGLMFFFQTSSMPIFSLDDQLINNYMAAIILSSSLTLWKLIYMLHKYISTQRLNTYSNSISTRKDMIKVTLLDTIDRRHIVYTIKDINILGVGRGLGMQTPGLGFFAEVQGLSVLTRIVISESGAHVRFSPYSLPHTPLQLLHH